tara:strand:+ start:576 stop:812 length:237 start_codon:yes stop_codon:yes gene_type:complete
MSKKIKPKEKKFNVSFDYNDEITASCACGTTFKTGSTNKNIRVDICATCHPFFTGENKFVDSEGRVEKFKKKYAKFNK